MKYIWKFGISEKDDSDKCRMSEDSDGPLYPRKIYAGRRSRARGGHKLGLRRAHPREGVLRQAVCGASVAAIAAAMASSARLGLPRRLVLPHGRASRDAGVRFGPEFSPVSLKCRSVRGEASAGEGLVAVENYGAAAQADLSRPPQGCDAPEACADVDARGECNASDKALFSNDADVSPARGLSSNGAHAAEFRDDGCSVTWKSEASSDFGRNASKRGSQHLSTTLQRKPSRQASIPSKSTTSAAKAPADKSQVFELGNSRLVIKSNPAKATSNVRKPKSTSEIVRKAVIDALAHTDNMEEALQRASESFGNRSTYWDQMMKELEIRGARRQALQVFRFLQEKSEFDLKEHNCVTIISILCREGKLGLAREIFEGMSKADIQPSVHSYTALLSGYAKQGFLKEAWSLYEVMKRKGCSPNVLTYNALINASTKRGYRLPDLVGLFEEMKRGGVQPNHITYNCLVNVCVCQKLFDTASQILKEMKAVNCLPNVISYTAMINSLGRSGRLDEAVDLYEEMKELGRSPNSWTYNSLLKAYAREGRFEKAMGLFVGMEEEGCLPDLYTYNTVIDMCGRGGLFAEAEGVFLKMQRKGCTPDRVTYNTLLDAYCKWGRRGKSRELLKSMKQAGFTPDLWTYNILLDAAGKASSVSEAMQIFHELKAAGHSPNLVSFSALINMYGRLGQFEEAESVWVEMRAAGCVPNATAYCGLMNSYSHHGMYKAALKTFEEMQNSGVVPDTRSYTTLMEAYGKAGLCDEAESLLRQMEAAGFIADIVTYGVLVKAFANAERYHEGLKYYDYVVQNSEPYHEPSQILITQHSAAYGDHRSS